MDTKISKAKLMEILVENRDKHGEVFRAAMAGYVKRAKEVLNTQLADFEAGRTPELRILLDRPVNNTPDYNRAIRMLELDLRDELVLSEDEVARLVMDDWSWKRTWLRMSNRYAAGATQQAYGVEEIEDGG